MDKYDDMYIFVKALKCLNQVRFEVLKDGYKSADVRVYTGGELNETEGYANFHFGEGYKLLGVDVYEESE